MKYVALLSIALLLLLGNLAHASINDDSQVRQMKKSVAQKFLREANDPKSVLGQKIAQLNEEMKDGRNPEGGIVQPIKIEALRVIALSNEQITNPWHYGEKKGQTCTATDGESGFLVLLATHTGVHMASEADSLLFRVSARQRLSAKVLKASDDGCEVLDMDRKLGPEIKTIEVDEIKQASLGDAK